MANDDAKEALLPQTQDVSHQFTEKNALKRRRYHSTGTTASPVLEINHQQQLPNGVQPNYSHSDSIFADQLSFRQVFMFLAAYLGVGAFCFFLVRNQIKGTKTNGVLDAIYFCVVTMTTVGYGDLVPDSILAKILACIFVFTGMALVGFVLSKAADYIVEKEEILFIKAIHMRERRSGSTDQILKEAETNKAKYKFLTTLTFILLLIIVGTFFLYQVEGLSLFDSLYGVCATITTLGYGDKSFSTKWGRLFAIFWIMISTISLAQLFLYLAELTTESRRTSFINWVLTRKTTVADLEAADLDHDNAVSLAEFVVHKLKEMGKISEEDVSIVVEIFKKLDADHSGSLTASDLMQ